MQGWANIMKHRAKAAEEYSTTCRANGNTHACSINSRPPLICYYIVLLTEHALSHAYIYKHFLEIYIAKYKSEYYYFCILESGAEIDKIWEIS